jgi:riboflavin kinase/FMN adenylyltransferase
MLTIRGLDGARPGAFREPILTLGTFDGVHLGHQAVVREVVRWARETGRSPVVLTFEGHPRQALSGETPRLLLPPEERLSLLAGLSIEATVLIPFTSELAATPPEDFARDVFARRRGARGVVLGHDAVFGRNREGNAAFLRRIGRFLGIEVREVPPVLVDGSPVSSSRIRTLVEQGDLAAAARLLGRPVAIFGEVVRGQGRGKELGFPTANLDLRNGVRPPEGVWSGRISIDGCSRIAVVSIGWTSTSWTSRAISSAAPSRWNSSAGSGTRKPSAIRGSLPGRSRRMSAPRGGRRRDAAPGVIQRFRDLGIEGFRD